jgi:hypothetical protein
MSKLSGLANLRYQVAARLGQTAVLTVDEGDYRGFVKTEFKQGSNEYNLSLENRVFQFVNYQPSTILIETIATQTSRTPFTLTTVTGLVVSVVVNTMLVQTDGTLLLTLVEISD